MPISFRSFSASIRVDGKDLEVYQPEFDEKTRTATGWIISEPGKEYAICYKRDQKDSRGDISSACYIDGGVDVGGMLCTQAWADHWVAQKAVSISATEERPLIFSDIKTSDDPSLLSSSETPKDPGTIRVELQRVKVLKDAVDFESFEVTAPSGIVHENTKKAGSHVTQFGAIRNYDRKISDVKYLDILPWVTFIFRYRPEAILQAEGIVPYTVESAKRPREDDADEVDDDDDEEEEAEIYALKAKLNARVRAFAARKKMKVEEVEANMSGKGSRFKQEDDIVVLDPGEVIDLTDD